MIGGQNRETSEKGGDALSHPHWGRVSRSAVCGNCGLWLRNDSDLINEIKPGLAMGYNWYMH